MSINYIHALSFDQKVASSEDSSSK